MFLFTIRAKPDPENDEVDDDVGGAYVNVWVNFPEAAAEVVAWFYIKETGWVPEMTIETSWVYEEDNDSNNSVFLTAAPAGFSSGSALPAAVISLAPTSASSGASA